MHAPFGSRLHASGAGNKKAAHRGGISGETWFRNIRFRASSAFALKAPWRLLPGCRIRNHFRITPDATLIIALSWEKGNSRLSE